MVVELDDTPDSAAVLQFGVTEARLRNAALRVLGSWQSRYTDIHDSHAVADGNRLVRAQLDRRLSHWKHLYPDLDVRPVAIHAKVGGQRGNGVKIFVRVLDRIVAAASGDDSGTKILFSL